jgi:hypothetical protein
MKAALDAYYPRSFFKLLLALALAVVGCSGAPGVKPVPEKVNLAGSPPEFRQGYANDCTSVSGRTVRNEVRFKTDYQYASGWRDGNGVCRH